MSRFKFIGCVLLIISCMIGAGILALPLLAAQLGVILTSVILIVFYILMCISGLLTLEVCSSLPLYQNHFSSLGLYAFGPIGKLLSILAFSIAIYGAIVAYIAASPDLIMAMLPSNSSFELPSYLISFLFTFLLGSVVICSMKYAEKLNRLIMIVKLGGLVLSMLYLISFTVSSNFSIHVIKLNLLSQSILAISLAFCYQLLIPSLINYVGKDNLKSLKQIIIIATTITCLIYLIWISVIVGFIATMGNKVQIESFSQLISAISSNNQAFYASLLIRAFLDVTLFASFIAVSIAFIDFWVDALNLSWKLQGRVIAGMIVFIPSYLAVTFYKEAFIGAVSISGYFGIIYALLLPSTAAYKRFKPLSEYNIVFGGRLMRGSVVICAFLMLILSLVGILLV